MFGHWLWGVVGLEGCGLLFSFVVIQAPTPMTSDKNVYLLFPISSLQKEIPSTEKHFKGFSSSLFFFPENVVISL